MNHACYFKKHIYIKYFDCQSGSSMITNGGDVQLHLGLGDQDLVTLGLGADPETLSLGRPTQPLDAQSATLT